MKRYDEKFYNSLNKSKQLYGYLLENQPDGLKISRDDIYLFSQMKELLFRNAIEIQVKFKESKHNKEMVNL